jgi:hypothetical protein
MKGLINIFISLIRNVIIKLSLKEKKHYSKVKGLFTLLILFVQYNYLNAPKNNISWALDTKAL